MRSSLARCFAYAFRGLAVTFKGERNFRIHLAVAAGVVGLGVYLGLSLMEWGLVVLAIGVVLAAETFNTAIERLSDEVAGGRRTRAIRNVKDLSAAAVLLCAIAALAIGVLVLVIPLVRKLAGLF